MVYRRVIIGLLVGLLFVGLNGRFEGTRADDSQQSWVSRIISLQGRVLAKRRGDPDWHPVALNDTLYAGDQIRVEANSRAGIVLSNNSVLRLDQNTSLVFTQIEQPTTFIFRLLKGAVNFFSHRPHSLKIFTPFVNGVVEGTEFYVQVDDSQTRIDLFEGRIRAENDQGVIQLVKGQSAVAAAGRVPRAEVMVHPRDSVQWALYYPPILFLGREQVPNALRESLELYNQNRTAEALDSMEAVPPAARDARFYTYRAALLLNVGRVDRALKDIQDTLAIDPANSEALALNAIIAVVQNRKEEAMALAQRAVQLGPHSAASHLALSYAHQAVFNLPAAQQDAQAAVENEPESGTAWARLAEMQLSVGQLDQGLKSAQKAAALNPGIARAQTIVGFAYLMQIKTIKARKAFNQAIILDSSAPLPRLGLGLSEIREGSLKRGREQIEIAAGLDPSNALIRSYLGKAYFDEKRGPLDEREFEIAKNLDPGDPTPWFYDAIRKQTLNRPVEALRDLQRSIELNDNRAVYRSRLLLDEDLAARSASIGRIFSDLDNQEMALRMGWHSLNIDPSNYSAHRLLADTYAARPRHRIARVSELLQSQLYQPLNLTPIQPQLAESTLLVPEGVGIFDSSFNEFNPLFSRDRTTFQLDAVAGEQMTQGEDLTLAGLQQWFSYSVGQSHFETNGFRDNNDLSTDIRDVFLQARLTEGASVQVAYRTKDTENGDLIQGFDPNDFSDNLRELRKESIPRFGFHYMPTPNQHAIVSLISNATDFSLSSSTESDTIGGPLLTTSDRSEDIRAYNAEGQYLFLNRNINLIIGAGHYQQDSSVDKSLTQKYLDYPTFIIDPVIESYDENTRHSNAYLYTTISPAHGLKAILGAGGDAFKKSQLEIYQFNPKLGISWLISPDLVLRASAFRTLKRSLVTNQTIEPTQVAGFNQFYDDPLATDARRYGIGIDYQMRPELFLGAELTYGDLSIPIAGYSTGHITEENWIEKLHRFYISWLPTDRLAISIDYRYEYTSREPQNPDNLPLELHTHYLPIGISYFHPSGFQLKFQGQYINQKVVQFISLTPATETKKDDFIIFDASVGYRFPDRLGGISISATNLFDTDFNFSDGNFAYGTAESPYIRPERQILMKVTFSF